MTCRRFVQCEDTVTYFDKIVMFSHRGKQIDILKGPVKLIKRVKIAHLFLVCVKSVPRYHFKLAACSANGCQRIFETHF